MDTQKMQRSTFRGYFIGERTIVEVDDDGIITIAQNATQDDLRSAISYMVMVIGQLTSPRQPDPILGGHADLKTAVLAAEWKIIKSALVASKLSVRAASKLLHMKGEHQSLLWILNGRHADNWAGLKQERKANES